MSLLLDARNKSQQTSSSAEGGSGLELTLEDSPKPAPSSTAASSATEHARATTESARATGQTLFSAKSASLAASRPRINRNLLLALGGTAILLAGGAGYVWYAIQPARPVAVAPPARPAPQVPKHDLVPGIAATQAAAAKPASIAPAAQEAPPAPARPAPRVHRQPRPSPAMLVEQQQQEPLDPILSDAYLAYRSGKLDQAELAYQHAHRLDASNIDAILGLAVIAQRQGNDSLAAHYYAQALVLDPRNAVANAGMSALTSASNPESRLKALLNEQPNSTALHFALGNKYAEQGRWSEAQQSYFNAYRLEPGNPQLAYNLAISLDHLGQKQAAAQYYQRALQLDPQQSAGFSHQQISQRIADLTR